MSIKQLVKLSKIVSPEIRVVASIKPLPPAQRPTPVQEELSQPVLSDADSLSTEPIDSYLQRFKSSNRFSINHRSKRPKKSPIPSAVGTDREKVSRASQYKVSYRREPVLTSARCSREPRF